MGNGVSRTLALTLALLVLPGLAPAATIQGTVRDALTSLPLSGLDIDILDDRFRLAGDGTTGLDGTYSVVGLNSGTYYVRVDATQAQGYVDEYHPGTSLPSFAAPLVLGSSTVLSGIDFALELGGQIAGIVRDDLGTPLVGIDLDVLGSDFSLLPSVDALTGLDGSYVLGALAPGLYYVRADPDPLLGQYHQDRYYWTSVDLAGAVAVTVTGTTTTTGIDFGLPLGGAISGTITDSVTGLPIDGIDIDIFDAAGIELLWVDAGSDEFGLFTLGNVPPGDYFVLADPDFDQPYPNTFFGGAPDLLTATPVTITAGAMTPAVNVVLAPFANISGTITDASTSLPIAGIDLDLLDAVTFDLVGIDATTAANGAYVLPDVPAGSYLVRADPTTLDGYVDEYHPGVFLRSTATPLVLTGLDVPGINFQLSRGVNISGVVTDNATGLPVLGVDLDVLTPSMQTLSSIDADTDAFGNYTIGALPPGDYIVRADPLPQSGFRPQYYLGSDTAVGSTLVTVGATNVSTIDFALLPVGVSATPLPSATPVVTVSPSPFSTRTTISLRGPLQAGSTIELFDVRGRKVRAFPVPTVGSDTSHQIVLDNRDDRGAPLASGTYFLKLSGTRLVPPRKLMLVR